VQKSRIPNLVVLTGDVHANYAAELKADFDDPLSDTIGTEFVGTSISSGGDGVDVPANVTVLRGENPHIKFVNTQRGYMVCDLTHRRWRSEYKTVPYVSTPGAPIFTRAAFTVQSGEPGLIEE
jgi:alkaline phosphatase D